MNDERLEGRAPDYPRPQGLLLGIDELRPADVLLSRGESRISDLIVEADRASYSHGAMWSGTGIIESTLKGGVEEHAPTGDRDVYRFRDPGRASGKDGYLSDAEAQGVVGWARLNVGRAYDTTEIYLLGVTFNRWWPGARPRRSLAGALLDAFGAGGSRLADWLQSVSERSSPRICTELVALAYFQSQHALRVFAPEKRLVVAPAPSDAEPAVLASLKALNAQVDQMIWRDDASNGGMANAGARGLLFGDLALDADSGQPIGVVTPGDLQFSPSLTYVGRLVV